MCDVSLFRVSNAVTVSRFQMHHVDLFSDWHLRIIITNHPGWIEPQADRLHFHFHIISHYFSTSSRCLPRKKWAKLRRQLVTFCDILWLWGFAEAPMPGTGRPSGELPVNLKLRNCKESGEWNSCLKMFKGHNFILVFSSEESDITKDWQVLRIDWRLVKEEPLYWYRVGFHCFCLDSR